MTLLSALRSKGHAAKLAGDGLTVRITLAPGADAVTAEAWARQNEQQLRRELFSEIQAAVGVRSVFQDARIRAVKGPDGKEYKGKVEVVTQ